MKLTREAKKKIKGKSTETLHSLSFLAVNGITEQILPFGKLSEKLIRNDKANTNSMVAYSLKLLTFKCITIHLKCVFYLFGLPVLYVYIFIPFRLYR